GRGRLGIGVVDHGAIIGPRCTKRRLLLLTVQSTISVGTRRTVAPSPVSPWSSRLSRQSQDSRQAGGGPTPLVNRASIGAAVIGTGFIGTVHVEQLRRIGVDVRGVLGSTPERGAARADALSVNHAYRSLDEILADPAVQVVHVTSPNHLHVPQASAILASGKHVVCEKPLAMTAAESAGLVAEAEASGLVNAVNFNIRFYPLHQHMREAVAAGELG